MKAEKKFEWDGKEHEITKANFFPTKRIGKMGAQGFLTIEIDALFSIRLMITQFEQNGKSRVAAFPPRVEHENKFYTQASFTPEADEALNAKFVQLARELYASRNNQESETFLDTADLNVNVV